MPGGNNNYRGRGRGPRGNSHDRGQGQGQGRGRGRGRGRGHGQYDDDRPHGGRYPHTEMDYVVQVWPEPPSSFPGGGGRGGPPRFGSGSATPQRGGSTPRRGGKWRGRGGSDTPRARPGFGANVSRNVPEAARPNAPLSKLLYSERPFLKPIIFVPSVYTRTLFEEVEDILQPVAESAGVSEESHVPTADRVTRVFSGGDPLLPLSSSSEDGHSEEELEELDFADMGKLRDQIDAIQSSTHARVVPVASSLREEVFTGMYNNHNHHHDTFSSHHVHVMPGDTDLAPTDTLISETNTTSTHEHSAAPFENSTATVVKDDEIVIEKPGTTPASSSPKVSVSHEINTSPAGPTGDDAPTFVIDTQPTRPFAHRSASDVILFDYTRGRAPLGEDDELIVYVAPHPRSGRPSPVPNVPRVRLPSRSMLTEIINPAQNLTASISPEDTSESKSVPGQPSEPPQFSSVSFNFASTDVKKRRTIFTSGDRSKTRAQARKSVRRRARRRQAMFGSFGAMLSEARLRDADERERKDARWESRRQDDSDIDWGDDDEVPEDDGVDEVSNGLGGMDLDPDLEPNLQAMQSFVKSMSAEGSRHITIDDIEDQERTRIEDEEEDENDSHANSSDWSNEDDDEEKAVFEVAEEILIAESQGERAHEPSPPECSNEEEDSSDNELSPRGSFEAKLRRIREKSRATQPVEQAPGDEELSDASLPQRANADEDYISHIEDLLEKHSGIIDAKDRVQRKQLFRAIQNGEFGARDDYVEWNNSFSYEEMQPSRRMKDKMKGLPIELQAMWEKDRAKKAERKRAREEARLLASIDALAPKKGGKKGRKAMQAAANLDPSVLAQLPNAIVDMNSLEKQIRRFFSDVSGKQNMVLPPMEKYARKRVHELANAFSLKSQSKGKGNGRYITLIKTKRTNFVNEQKVKKIVKSYPSGYKDGDEVGKAAPKIGETNVGFKMLASMGWTEGDRIGGGASTGINAPLTAIIKKTKLGLGASR